MTNRPNRIERHAYKWLLKMLEDPGRHTTALERWLSRDPQHRAIYKRVAVEVGRASGSAARIPSLRASAASSGEPKRSGWITRRRMVAIGGLIAMSAAVIGTFGLPDTGWYQPVPWDHHGEAARVYASAESQRVIRLEDGSEVTLFADTRITTRFTNDERSVDLVHGRARFAVSHDTARPFVVYAVGGTVTATGTLFEVAIADGVKVRLISGAVEVSLPRTAEAQPRKVVHLGPGEQVSYSPPSETASQPLVETAAPVSMQTVESFDDVPAAQIAEKVNQRSVTKIVFADPALGRRQVFGDLDTSSADAVAQTLAALLELTVDRSQPNRLLLKNRG